MKKYFFFNVDGIEYKVVAEKEGVCRYIVRVSTSVNKNIIGRIGYIFGRGSNWIGEATREREGFSKRTASDACQALLEKWLVQTKNSGV